MKRFKLIFAGLFAGSSLLAQPYPAVFQKDTINIRGVIYDHNKPVSNIAIGLVFGAHLSGYPSVV